MTKQDNTAMNNAPMINDTLYRVTVGENSARLHIGEDDCVEVLRNFRNAKVTPIIINAISNVETTAESAKYFFTVRTRYYYSDKVNGVAIETSYFELSNNPDKAYGICRYDGVVFLTEEEANAKAIEWDESQALHYEERKEELIGLLNKAKAQL